MMPAPLPELANYVGGKFFPPTVPLNAQVCDANTRLPLQTRLGAGPEIIETALQAAEDCWLGSDYQRDDKGRVRALHAMADYFRQPGVVEQIAVADARTTGVVIGAARRLAKMTPFLFRGAAQVIEDGDLCDTRSGPAGSVEYFRRPWGPALLISPWNGPTAIGAHKLASAIAAGAPALVKPSTWTPHSAILMARAACEAGLPDGAVNLIMGDRTTVGAMLTDDRVKAISFTGGLGGGRAVARACADDFKPTQLELGGNNSLVVLEGADIDAAAEGIVFGLANLNGQWCRALGRIIVHSR